MARFKSPFRILWAQLSKCSWCFMICLTCRKGHIHFYVSELYAIKLYATSFTLGKLLIYFLCLCDILYLTNDSLSFRFMSGKSGRIYLHTDIRMIICRKSDVDTASDFGSEPPKELRSYIHGPTNPKFSPRCWASWLFPWGCCQPLQSPSPQPVYV